VARLGTLLVVYHRPFWRAPDGSLWEREGAFSRYVESIAPHFERILLAVPETSPPTLTPQLPTPASGHRLDAPNVELAALPFFDGLPRFFSVLPGALAALWRAVGQADLVNLRLPTPAGPWAFALARLRRRPVFLLIVGDQAAVAKSVPSDSLRRRLYHAYVRLEEQLLQAMINRSLAITNGRALFEKHARSGRPIFETRNSTIRRTDVGRPREPYRPPRVRLLCVSRVDPRKGLRFLPAALAMLRARAFEPSLDILGPTVGRLGEEEQAATLAEAGRLGIEGAVRFRGAATLEQVAHAYTEHDLLLVPSLPGEGIPRVLLEAMAAGLPVVATRVAGIPDLVCDGENGLLVAPGDGEALGRAAARLLEDEGLRACCVEGGYATAREHTADAQAERLVEIIGSYVNGGLSPRLTQVRMSSEHSPPPSPSGRGCELPLPLDEGRAEGSAARPIRVTIPLAGLNLSGGVKSLVVLANRLAQRGQAVRLMVPDYAAEPPVPLDPRVQLSVLRTPGRGPLRKLAYLLRLARAAAEGSDVVVANYFLTAYPAFLSWLLHGRRAALAYNIRGYEPWSHGLMAPASTPGRYLRFLLAWQSYRLPFTRLVTTDWLARMVGDRDAVVVGHGIDLDVFAPSPPTPLPPSGRGGSPPLSRSAGEGGRGGAGLTIGVIGRFGAVKGYPDFLEAAGALPDNLAIRFLVARADPVLLPSRYAAEVVEARTEVEMARFYNRCDVFVFPSLAEGFGLPALEAMACGCAVITTDCGGVSTFARPEENCLMVPPGRPERLAEAMARLARDVELRARLAEGGVEMAKRFDRVVSLDRLADAIVALARRR
jgi:glycosyltransferase involved in cell wall biosynthesis